MRAKLASWKLNFLSHAGRLTLIRSTLNAIPAYIMQYFLLPTTISAAINKIQRDFLWGTSALR